VHEGDRVFYFTTCGWMMWNWLASALGCGATLCLYDGSPFHPAPTQLFDYAEAERFTLFGTSARYLDSVRKLGLKPIETHDLASVRAILSTGSPLAPDCFDYVYAQREGGRASRLDLGRHRHPSRASCSACRPCRCGAVKSRRRALGLAVEVFDEDGQPMAEGKGELVCRAPFPSDAARLLERS
jgi:acetoacetyl-CoA synthetase